MYVSLESEVYVFVTQFCCVVKRYRNQARPKNVTVLILVKLYTIYVTMITTGHFYSNIFYMNGEMRYIYLNGRSWKIIVFDITGGSHLECYSGPTSLLK